MSILMTRIEKIDAEIQKARQKAAEINARIRALEGQKTDEENLLIIQTVRSFKMSHADLRRFLERHSNNLGNPAKTPKVLSAIQKNNESETNKND